MGIWDRLNAAPARALDLLFPSREVRRVIDQRNAEIEADRNNEPELTLEDEANVMPGNLSYENWQELAAQRGVALEQLEEWTAMPVEQRPLSPEAESERDAREEAYVERQLAEAYEADAQADPAAEAAFAALDSHPKRDYGNEFAGFEFEGDQLYARRDRDGVQILTPEEAEVELADQRVQDPERALLQAIHDEASYEADYAMPRPPAHASHLGGAYYAEWDRAEQIAGDRYSERVDELAFDYGLPGSAVRDEQARLAQEAQQRYEERRAQRQREAEEQGIEITPF